MSTAVGPPCPRCGPTSGVEGAVEASPAAAGMQQANWSWKVVRQFMAEHLGVTLSRSSCWNYLRRLGFVWKRPKKRLLKADAAQREAFVATYADLRQAAAQRGATIFFVDEAHFRADVEVRNKWVLRGAALGGSVRNFVYDAQFSRRIVRKGLRNRP